MIAADTHVHLYPNFDLAVLFESAREHLALPGVFEGTKPFRILFTADRAGFPKSADLVRKPEMWRTGPMPEIEEEGGALVALTCTGDRFVIAPGRQIISKENLEVLALASECDIAEGAPVAEIINEVCAEGGVPVLPWSPGKWWFERGKAIFDLLQGTEPHAFLLGDVFMRPHVWPTPALLQKGLESGHRILAGSDPLDGSGEERIVGRYGILGEMRENGSTEDAFHQAQRFLREGRYRRVGARAGLETFARRMWLAKRMKQERLAA